MGAKICLMDLVCLSSCYRIICGHRSGDHPVYLTRFRASLTALSMGTQTRLGTQKDQGENLRTHRWSVDSNTLSLSWYYPSSLFLI